MGHSGTPAISCSHKAAAGFIYPLDRGFIFVYKPPIYIRYDEVKNVSFERSGGSTRSFDIEITTTHDINYTFSSIEKGEYGRLYEFLKKKSIKIKSSGKAGKSGLVWDEDRPDHLLEKVKADAQEFDSGDDSMSSDDSDFNPDALEALSAKEEYDSEPSTTSDEDESDGDEKGPEAEKRREERKKKKEEKKEKAKKRSEKKEQRTKRKVKLPGQPKRNMSAYFIWMNENRENINKEYPDLTLAEFGKKAGELWKAMEDKSVSLFSYLSLFINGLSFKIL